MSAHNEGSAKPNVWEAVGPLIRPMVIQNTSSDDNLFVRIGTALPAVDVYTGLMIGPGEKDTFSSEDAGETIYIRTLGNDDCPFLTWE